MRARTLAIILPALLAAPSSLAAEAYPFAGANLGVAQPTNDNYNAHAHTGIGFSPFAGYMFTENLGLQLDVHTTFMPPDDDGRGIEDEGEWSTLLGFTVGPRMAVPLGPLFEVHVEGGVGAFTGLSGRLTQSDWGFSVGAGLDYYVAPRWALTAYGRWNGAAIAPVPHFLPPRVISGRPQNPEDQGPADIRWATGGIGLRYDFRRPPVVLETAPPEPWVAQVPPPATYVPPPAPTPARLPPPPPTDVRLPPPPRRIVLRDVHFAYDSARILPDSFARLDRAAATLRELGWPDVVVEGHTDSRGTDAYNDALSQRRADAVRRYLIERGAPAQSLRAVGYGERRPVASNETASGRAENRRVELNLQGGARSDPRYY